MATQWEKLMESEQNRLDELADEVARLQQELKQACANLTVITMQANEYLAERDVARLDARAWQDRCIKVVGALWVNEQPYTTPAQYLELGGEDATAAGEFESGWVQAARLLAELASLAAVDADNDAQGVVSSTGVAGQPSEAPKWPSTAERVEVWIDACGFDYDAIGKDFQP